MYWANFLHIYQPPTQTEEIVRKVTDECYRKLVEILSQAPSARVTLNINACLTEQLDRYGLGDVIEGLRSLAERDQIEFTGSAMYHPILPLIPRSEMVRQIELNTAVNRKYFGDVYNPKGFFPPEMCYSQEVAQVVADLGYRWIIVDEIAFNGKLGSASDKSLYRVGGLKDFYVFFKERPFSAGITYGSYPDGESFLAALGDRTKLETYLLTGTDGEVYGHHRPGQEKLLQDMYAKDALKTCTVSDLLDTFQRLEVVKPLASSWSTWEDEMAANAPYAHWSYPGNELHELQWKLTDTVIELVTSMPANAEHFEQARHLLDEGLHSCQYWWASCRPWWDTGMIERGAASLFEAVKVVEKSIPEGKFSGAKKIYHDILQMAQEWQRTGKAQHLRQDYLSSHPQVASELTFGPQ
jgi:predicted glycosyl hydrolase (DUF1957 family)